MGQSGTFFFGQADAATTAGDTAGGVDALCGAIEGGLEFGRHRLRAIGSEFRHIGQELQLLFHGNAVEFGHDEFNDTRSERVGGNSLAAFTYAALDGDRRPDQLEAACRQAAPVEHRSEVRRAALIEQSLYPLQWNSGKLR